MIKKTEFLAYNTPIKADGIIAIKIRDDDELVAVRRTSGDDDIIMVSRSGQAARFSEDQARPMGRDTGGVRGMNVSRGDNRVLAMDVVRPDTELLVVTDAGYGKRTAIDEYPVKGRGTMGVKTISLTEKKGGLAGALIVREHQELVFISQNGMVQRTGVRGISKQGRSAQGVRVMNLREDDVGQRRGPRGGDLHRHLGRGPGGHRGGGRRRRGFPGGGRGLRGRLRGFRGRPRGLSPAARSASMPLPGKGGGPELSDSSCGTLEVSGR